MQKPNMIFEPMVSGSKRGGSLYWGIGSLSQSNLLLAIADGIHIHRRRYIFSNPTLKAAMEEFISSSLLISTFIRWSLNLFRMAGSRVFNKQPTIFSTTTLFLAITLVDLDFPVISGTSPNIDPAFNVLSSASGTSFLVIAKVPFNNTKIVEPFSPQRITYSPFLYSIIWLSKFATVFFSPGEKGLKKGISFINFTIF